MQITLNRPSFVSAHQPLRKCKQSNKGAGEKIELPQDWKSIRQELEEQNESRRCLEAHVQGTGSFLRSSWRSTAAVPSSSEDDVR
jgi:hypothetical protein